MIEQKSNKNYDRNWGWLLGLGILFILLGCIGLGMAVGLTLVSMLFVGILFIIAGIAQTIDAFKCKPWKGALWHLLIALLYITGGGVIIYNPVLASVLFTAFLAWILIAMGLSRLIMAYILKDKPGWAWLLIAGLTTIGLGILILLQWPYSALWIIGLFIAIELIVNGWSYVLMAFSAMR